MPTQSDILSKVPVRNEEWTARSATPQRSVFGNYAPNSSAPVPGQGSALDSQKRQEAGREQLGTEPLQTAIDVAMARFFLYRFLAQAYEDPTEDRWAKLADPICGQSVGAASALISFNQPGFADSATALAAQLKKEVFESFLSAYLLAFGHAARGRCPPNEIEYGDLKADPLFQPHRLADLAAFYRAFGLEVSQEAGERHDHICLEMEFMCVLAAKEAYALEHQLDPEELALCRNAQKRFLREHLARWTPAFCRRLARMTKDSPLEVLANFTRGFIEAECALFGIPAGNDDLLLRPADSAAETMCHSCGVTQLPPGASNPEAAAI